MHTFAKMCGAFDVIIVFCESNFLVANKLASYLIFILSYMKRHSTDANVADLFCRVVVQSLSA